MGSDHEFNPHTYLVSSLDEDEIRRIRKGERVHPRRAARTEKKTCVAAGWGTLSARRPPGLTTKEASDIATKDLSGNNPKYQESDEPKVCEYTFSCWMCNCGDSNVCLLTNQVTDETR